MSAPTLTRGASRAVTSLSRNGVRGTAARARRWIVQPLVRLVWLQESHIWLTVNMVYDPEPLPDGYELRPGGPDDLDAIEATGGIPPVTGRAYLEAGARLFVATYGDELAFSTWVHTRTVPLYAAPGGRLVLPAGVVSIEDSLAAADHRRSGIGLAVIHQVTAMMGREGVADIITRIAEENAPARAWARKMGVAEVATMRLRRIGPWRRVRTTPLPGGERIAAVLAEQVDGA